ncbi:deacetylase [Corallococcus sp. AB049A]|uniref:Deacetylase n=1 Tax=Corallococcus interemptor TaxID=2316720 RepID=A0A3A8R5D0_9BACT|nr:MULTISPECIES: deacetylase [Corallococcus]RKH43513.1 deacetylase [Corallococcus sp. AB050B]RKH74055.1 deacetylase [Corallococcus interemptor]RKI68736.1 deacetylase [Corallococcus sp. AB049A]
MPRTPELSSHARRTYSRLSSVDLAASAEAPLSLDDLGLEPGADRVGLAFGTYSREGLERALQAYGFAQRLEDRVGPVELRLSCQDPFQPRITLLSRRYHSPVVDLSLRQAPGAEVGFTRSTAEAPLLYVDSLLLQHPGRPFDWNRPPLPGQLHPGLSLSRDLMELLHLMARRIGAEGVALMPATFSAACVYEPRFTFVDGAKQGHFSALRRAGRGWPRWVLAWAVELGCMRDAEGQPALFTPTPMISPLSRRVARRLETRGWQRAWRFHSKQTLSLDEEALQARFPWARMPPGPPPERVVEMLGYDPLAPASLYQDAGEPAPAAPRTAATP